jgi:polyphosphate kinase
MPRNINHRVEVLFPVQDRRIIRYLRDDVLQTYLIGNVKVRQMNANGVYSHLSQAPGEPPINPQEWLIHHRLRKS